METVRVDYEPKGVKFFYVYKALAHPENNGYVQPFTLEERLLHVKEAQRTLGSEITWIADNMDNDLKHNLGNAPNSEFIIDPEGRIVHKRSWSKPDQVRVVGDFEEKKPGFSEKAGLLKRKITHYPGSQRLGRASRPDCQSDQGLGSESEKTTAAKRSGQRRRRADQVAERFASRQSAAQIEHGTVLRQIAS